MFTIENITIFGGFMLYIIASFSYLFKGNYPWALIWFCYALANLGLIWAASKK